MKRESASTGGAHAGFFEHALRELREEHRHLAGLALDPAARKQRAEDVEILLQTHLLAVAQIVAPVAERHVQVVREAAPRRMELRRERAEPIRAVPPGAAWAAR